MINYLKDIKKETLIGQLPDVINNNNDSIRKEFNWMFDSSLNRLTKSVYAPTGSVKAHVGEFVNLSCEYLTIKNEESIKNSIQSTVNLVIADSFDPSTKQLTNHNILNHRFIDSQYEGATDYMHDAASIVYKKENDQYVSVKDVLDRITDNDASLKELYKNTKQHDTSIQELYKNTNGHDTSIQELYKNTNGHDVSINSLNNKITSIAEDVTELNTNNILIPQRGDDIILNKNQNNILFEPINANNIKINIKFDKDEYVHEYNFKFILSRAANEVYLNMDRWFIPSRDRLFINNNNDNIKITYNAKDNIFILTRADNKNIIMCDVTINKYIYHYGVCTMSCKIYNYLG